MGSGSSGVYNHHRVLEGRSLSGSRFSHRFSVRCANWDVSVTVWSDTGYGGSDGSYSFQRMSAEIGVSKNGTQFQMLLTMPNSDDLIWLSFNQKEFREFLKEREGIAFGGHGDTAMVRVETDMELKI